MIPFGILRTKRSWFKLMTMSQRFLAGSLEDATAENIELDVMEAFISSPRV